MRPSGITFEWDGIVSTFERLDEETKGLTEGDFEFVTYCHGNERHPDDLSEANSPYSFFYFAEENEN